MKRMERLGIINPCTCGQVVAMLPIAYWSTGVIALLE